MRISVLRLPKFEGWGGSPLRHLVYSLFPGFLGRIYLDTALKYIWGCGGLGFRWYFDSPRFCQYIGFFNVCHSLTFTCIDTDASIAAHVLYSTLKVVVVVNRKNTQLLVGSTVKVYTAICDPAYGGFYCTGRK